MPKVLSVTVYAVPFPVPERSQTDPELVAMDLNSDGSVDQVDSILRYAQMAMALDKDKNGRLDQAEREGIKEGAFIDRFDLDKNGVADMSDHYDNEDRARAYLSVYKPGYEKHTQYLLDTAEMAFYIGTTYELSMGVVAFEASIKIFGGVNIDEPAPCLLPFNMEAMISAENSLRRFAKRQGWPSDFRFMTTHYNHDELYDDHKWNPGSTYSSRIGLDPDENAFVEIINVDVDKIKRHPLGKITEGLFAEVFAEWNIMATVLASHNNASSCALEPHHFYEMLRTAKEHRKKDGELGIELDIREIDRPYITLPLINLAR